ncbi:MAG: hypothetical protein PHE51_00410 [Eubacteriales bacterium]|nr:hypothetical protein [Eubacteriales bacterium]
MKKHTAGLFMGFIAGVGAALMLTKINSEINEMPSETGSYSEKAGKWLKSKKTSIRQTIDIKKDQITNIVSETKEALVGEDSAEKRKEIMDKASAKIAEIKDEIKALISKSTKEISALASKLSKSELFKETTEFISELENEGEIVDVDYSFEQEFEE